MMSQPYPDSFRAAYWCFHNGLPGKTGPDLSFPLFRCVQLLVAFETTASLAMYIMAEGEDER